MNILKWFASHKKQDNADCQCSVSANDCRLKSYLQPFDDSFGNAGSDTFIDTYLLNAWVNIAVNILIRNVARAYFIVEKEGEEVLQGPLYDLFRRPNTTLSRFDLWKETAGWWFLEGGGFLVVRPGLLRRFA
jgi:hypothetical protein